MGFVSTSYLEMDLSTTEKHICQNTPFTSHRLVGTADVSLKLCERCVHTLLQFFLDWIPKRKCSILNEQNIVKTVESGAGSILFLLNCAFDIPISIQRLDVNTNCNSEK